MQYDGAPKVSILVPICNVEKFLAKCLDSLTGQTLQEIEILCINDGSTDNSLAIIQSFAAKDSRIVIIDKPNSGYGDSMNRGLVMARGEYVGIVESDDFVDKNMFEELYRLTDNGRLDIVRSDYAKYWEDRGDERVHFNKMDALYNIVFTPSDHPEIFMINPAIWSTIYRRAFLQEEGIWFLPTPGASYQDTSFFIKTLFSASTMYFTDQSFLHYRQDNAGSSVKNCALPKALFVNQEYRECDAFLQKDAKKFDKVKKYYNTRKLSGLFWNLKRVDEKRKYLSAMRKDIQDILDTGCYYKSYLTAFQNALLFYMKCYGTDTVGELLPGASLEGDGPPLISVIIPVYNAAEYLDECLRSLTKQTFRRFEVICVDDGSTDNSATILQRYAATDTRFIVLKQKNAGAGTARNYGMTLAQGLYLMFLDSDDIFEPVLLERLYMAIKGTEAEVVVCRSDRFDHRGREFTPCPWTIKADLLPSGTKSFCSTEVKKDFFNLFIWWPWDKIYKKSHIDSLGLQFQDLRTTNDLYFVASAAVAAKKLSYIDDVLVHQRSGLKSSLSVTREQSWDCFYHALTELKVFLQKQGLYPRFERDFINYAASFSLWQIGSIHGNTYCTLYKALQNKWLAEFGVADKGEEYFYDKTVYHNISKILHTDLEQDLADKIHILEKKLEKAEAKAGTERSQEYWREQAFGQKISCNSDSPKISVIVPIYNTGKYLAACMNSLLKQTFQDTELICVDDGSTDNSLQILREFAAADGRIRVIEQTNKGVGAARNAGIALAQGKYLLFVDSDDLLLPEALEYLWEESCYHEADILYFDAEAVFEDKTMAERHSGYGAYYKRSSKYETVVSGEKLFSKMLKAGDWRMSPCLQFIRRDFLCDSGVRFFEGIIHEDNLFSAQLILKARRAAHRSKALYIRTVHAGSTMTRPETEKNLKGYFVCLRELLRDVIERDLSDVGRNALLDFVNSLKGHVVRIYKKLPTNQRNKSNEWALADKTLLTAVLMGGGIELSFVRAEGLGFRQGDENGLPLLALMYCKKTSVALSAPARRSYQKSNGRLVRLYHKAQGGICCYQEHGFWYTFKRTLQHLHLV